MTRDNADLAYGYEQPMCGDVWAIRRTLALVNRIEGRFGAITPLVRRLEHSALGVQELAHLLWTLVEDAPASQGVPKRAAIEQWVIATGVAAISRPLARELLLFVAGNDVLKLVMDSRMGTAPAKEGPVGPFATMAASTGASG
jgi:hypothetical protein